MKRIFISLVFVVFLSLYCCAYQHDGYVVKIKESAMESMTSISLFSDRALLYSQDDGSGVVELLAEELEDVSEINSNHMLVKANDEQALADLIDLGVVEYYEENIYAELHGYDFSKNPFYSSQKWYLDVINADFSWNAGIFGGDTKVAVIDSGIYPHDDIKNSILLGKNYIDGESVSDTSDIKGHGTSVAGLIAAQCNSIGIVGVSPRTKVVPLKVTNDNKIQLSYIISAIYDAVDEYECDVINMSFGMSTNTTNLEEAVNYALSKNVIIVASAGNDDDNGYRYPASYNGVISVANAQKLNDTFSIAQTSQKNDLVDIAAPGTAVTSLGNSSNGIVDATGTSFSAPIVSAVGALAKSVDPSITSVEFERLIKQTANNMYVNSSGQNSTAWGSGMLDIEEFFKALIDEEYYISKKMTLSDKTSVYITNFTDTAVDNGTIVVSEYDENGFLESKTNIPISLGAYSSYEFSLTDNGFSSSSVVSFIGNRIAGDVDGDGEVSLRDASLILRYLAGYDVTVAESILDVDGDKMITLRDASSIMRFLAGYDVVLH